MKDKEKEVTAKKAEDKHTSECKKAYDAGFAEKCAEAGVDPQQLMSWTEKQAQSSYQRDLYGGGGGVVPTNPAINYGRSGPPDDIPEPTEAWVEKKKQEAQDAENYGAGSAWDAFGFGEDSWASVGGAKRGVKNVGTTLGKGRDWVAEQASDVGGGLSMMGNAVGNMFGDVGRMGKNMWLYGNLGSKDDYVMTKNPWEQGGAYDGSADPANKINPSGEKNIPYEKWRTMSTDQKIRAGQYGITLDQNSKQEYAKKMEEQARKAQEEAASTVGRTQNLMDEF